VKPDEFEAWATDQACADQGRGEEVAKSRKEREKAGGGRLMEAGTATRRPISPPEVGLQGLRQRQGGWLRWLTTTDHKRIGIMYLYATFLFFILGGVEALIMRLQLAQPNNTLVSPETYNGLVTMHGTTMVFLFLVPVLAGFGTTSSRS
jgi:hypothetical protein